MYDDSVVCCNTLCHLDGNDDLSLIGKLDGIADKIHQYLAQASWVAHEVVRHLRMHTVDELQSLFVSSQSERLERGAETVAQVKINVLESELTGFNLRKVKNIVDNVQQRFPRGLGGR